MYDIGATSARAIGVQLRIHARAEPGVCRENIATNIATMAQMARLLAYAGHTSAPATTGSWRTTDAMRAGSTMQNTPIVASSHAPIRATGSNGFLNASRSANPSVTSCTARTASSITPD